MLYLVFLNQDNMSVYGGEHGDAATSWMNVLPWRLVIVTYPVRSLSPFISYLPSDLNQPKHNNAIP